MKFAEVTRDTIKALPRTELGKDIIDFFNDNPESIGVAIVDHQNFPIGYIDRVDFMIKASGLYGRALYDNRPADTLSTQNYQLLDDEAEVSSLVGENGLKEEINRQTGLVIVDADGRYLGITNAMQLSQALLRNNQALINELKLEVHERKAAEERARRLSESDPLTGLHNRRRFISHVNELVEAGKEIAVIYIDLDRFKVINDVRGHAIGDFVLKTVAVRLMSAEHTYTPARLGGDEFAVIVDLTSLEEDLEQATADLHTQITQPIMTPAGVLDIGASLGVACYPEDASEHLALIDGADRAMLRAKSRGGGHCRFDDSFETEGEVTAEIKARLHRAVHARQIIPAFQPIVSLHTNEIIGHEVLARWPQEEGRDPVSPGVFIPAAEAMGLIDPLFWSLVDQVMAMQADLGDDGFIALNISPPQLRSAGFAERLERTARQFGVPLERIELEMTETAVVTDTRASKAILETLAAKGVTIALDDFGTGYSSLSMLREFPISKLKIDQSFVFSADKVGASSKIIDATIGLSHGLGLVCCAEGVETQSALDMLRQRGCDQAQGYFIGEPAAHPIAPGDLRSSATTELLRATA